MHVLDQYIGLPYAEGGRGPAWDCVGLFLRLQRELFGRALPDPLCARENAAHDPRVIAARDDWKQIQHPMAGDAALYGSGGAGLHVACIVDAMHILHIEGPRGSVLERIDSPRRITRLQGYFRHV